MIVKKLNIKYTTKQHIIHSVGVLTCGIQIFIGVNPVYGWIAATLWCLSSWIMSTMIEEATIDE